MRLPPLLFRLLAALAVLVVQLLPLQPLFAAGVYDYPAEAPQQRLIDPAGLFSRSTAKELQHRLEDFEAGHVQAHLLSVERLDYGLELESLGRQIVERWSQASPGGDSNLLLLIDAQTNTAAVVASPDLLMQLPEALLISTADTTMGLPMRMGSRYRQASLEALNRLEVVLNGADDPGPPEQQEQAEVVTNIPTRAETAAGSGFTWVVVLLVVGTIVPMLTWWVFSR